MRGLSAAGSVLIGAAAPLALLLALLLPASATVAGAAVAQVDEAAIGVELAERGVAVHDASADQAALAQVVAEARDDGLHLSVVVLGDNLTGGLPATEAFAGRLRDGSQTVLVLTPDWLAADSGELTDAAMQRALDAAESAGADDVAAARQFADAALGRGGLPWGWLIAGGVVLAVAAIVGGRWWEQRRRRQADVAALAEITKRLRAQLSGVADAVVALEPQVPLAGEQARQRYTEASVAYQQVRDELERSVRSRVHGERVESRLAEIRGMLDHVRDELDQARQSW